MQTNTTILSQNIRNSLDFNESHLNNNVLALGWARAGKTYRFISPNIAQMNTNYIVIDAHDELYKRHAKDLRDNGYNVMDINFSEATGAHYNPFHYLNTESHETVIRDLIKMTEVIIAATEPNEIKSDPFYAESEKLILSTLMLHTYFQNEHMASFVHLFDTTKRLYDASDIHAEYKLLLDEIEAKCPRIDVVLNAYKFVEKTPETEWTYPVKVFKGIFISLAARLMPFQYYYVDKNEAKKTDDELHLEQFVNDKKALFISLPFDQLTQPLETLLLWQAAQVLMKSATNNANRITRIVLDEFVNLGRIPEFESMINIASAHNLAYFVVVQSLEQMKIVYKDHFDEIIAACSTVLSLGRIGFFDSEYLNKLFGNEIVVGYGVKKQSFFDKLLKKESIKYEQVRLFTKEELVCCMDVSKCIVYRCGHKPVLDDKYMQSAAK